MAEDSGYYAADEATRRLARKRQLARLLEEQSFKFNLPNPNARASWTNVAAPLMEALVGKLKGEEADAEGKKLEAEQVQAQRDAWAEARRQGTDLPERPDMNLPGDLRQFAGQDYPEAPPAAPPAPSPLAAQMVQEQVSPPPTAAPSDLTSPLQAAPDVANPARNPMAQLLAGPQQPSLGDQMLGDQANAPTLGALKPPAPEEGGPLPALVPKFGALPAGPSLVPTPPTRINIGGVSPQQAKIDEAIVKADMAKSGLAGAPTVRGPAPPEEQAAAQAFQAGAGAPSLVPQPPAAAVAPSPQQGPPLLPNGQIDMAPQGMRLPAQPGKRFDAYDMVDTAMNMPPGRMRDQFVEAAFKSALTEPDRRLAKQELDQRKREETAMRERLGQATIQSKETTTAMRTASAERNAKTRAETAEKLANLRLGAGATGFGQEYDQLPARQQAVVDWYATQQLGGDSTWRVGLSRAAGGANLIKAVDERVPTMGAEIGITAADAGTNRATLKANQSALTHLTTDINTVKPFAQMLDQNADILKDLAGKIIKTQSPLANKPINWLMDNAAGDPDVAEYLAQMRLVQTEAARVITNPRLVGQLTDQSQRELEHIINGNMSLDATERVLDRLKNDSQRRVGLMESQRDSLTGQIKGMMTGGRGTPTTAAAPGPDSAAALRSEAKAAIEKGKDPAAVRARFKQMTGQEL